MTRIDSRSPGEAALLWQLKAMNLPEPEPNYRFAYPRRWRFDFAYPDRLLAIEVEGGQWIGGRHTTGKGFEADLEKYNEAALRGWIVIRVTPRMIDDGRAINLVVRGLTTTAQTIRLGA